MAERIGGSIYDVVLHGWRKNVEFEKLSLVGISFDRSSALHARVCRICKSSELAGWVEFVPSLTPADFWA